MVRMPIALHASRLVTLCCTNRTSEDDPMDDAWDDIVNMPGIPNAIKKKARQRQRRKQYVV